MVSEGAVVVKITSILRPVGIANRFSDPVGPFLGFEVEAQQLCRIQVQRRQMLTVRRPARAEKILRTRNSRDLVTDEVDDIEGQHFPPPRLIGSPEGDLLAVRGPG